MDANADTLASQLAELYFTTSQAVDFVRERFPGMDFSHRQISRAIADGNLQATKVGRLLYIRKAEVQRYADNLMESHKQPGKLRLRPSSLRG